MLKKVLSFALLKFYKIKARSKSHFPRINIFEHIQKSSRVLLCLPVGKNENLYQFLTPEKLQAIFPEAKITILKDRALNIPHEMRNVFQVVEYDDGQLDQFGLPQKATQQQLLSKKFDTIIDLSIPFHHLNTAITWKSRAPLRIGFSELNRDRLYNFVVRLKDENSASRSYQLLFQYLKN